MDVKLKVISASGIAEAISKAEVYRNLNQPEESESICRDILAADPGNHEGSKILGLALTDQFTGEASDRYAEVEEIFSNLPDPYERLYYMGILHERRLKAQLQAGRSAHTVLPLLEEALRCFADAEKIRPQGNDDSILRWNRCVRLLQSRPDFERQEELVAFDAHDSPPY